MTVYATLGTPIGDRAVNIAEYTDLWERLQAAIPELKDGVEKVKFKGNPNDPHLERDLLEVLSGITIYVGGTAANVMSTVAALTQERGDEVRYFGSFGDDESGQIITTLEQNHNIIFFPGILEGAVTNHSALFRANDKRQIVKFSGSSCDNMNLESLNVFLQSYGEGIDISFISLTLFSKFDSVVVQSFVDAMLAAGVETRSLLSSNRESVEENRERFSNIIAQSEMIFGNAEELLMQFPDAAGSRSVAIEELQKIMLDTAVALISNGKEGAFIITKHSVEVVDICEVAEEYSASGGKLYPTGAGDATVAGFMAAKDMGLNNTHAAEFAMVLAANCITCEQSQVKDPQVLFEDFLADKGIDLQISGTASKQHSPKTEYDRGV